MKLSPSGSHIPPTECLLGSVGIAVVERPFTENPKDPFADLENLLNLVLNYLNASKPLYTHPRFHRARAAAL